MLKLSPKRIMQQKRAKSKEDLLPLVFGLGNPGPTYQHSRHNVGFDAVEQLAAFFQTPLRKRCFRPYKRAQVESNGTKSLLVQPLTFMNNSGLIGHYFIPKRYKVEQLIVICDNLDLPVGTIRIRKGGSSAGHKGLDSMMKWLKESNFIRVYVGIGRPIAPKSVIEHVLENISDTKEREALQGGVTKAFLATLALIEGATLEEVEREFNRKNSSNSAPSTL